MAFAQVPMGVAFVVMGALRGAGDTKSVLFLAMFSVWCIRLVLAWVFVNVFGMGLAGAWYAMAIDWVARSSIAIFRFRSGKWRALAV
jgi:Na+-driven multidrug efflux pump